MGPGAVFYEGVGGGTTVKINLTRLLELQTRTKLINEDQYSTAYNFIEYFDVTSSDRAYSFELENEEFSLR